MKQHVYPAEKEIAEYYAKRGSTEERWKKSPVLERLKEMAKAEGLWNFFFPSCQQSQPA